MTNRFKAIVKPVLVAHASIKASIILIFVVLEVVRLNFYTGANSVEPRLLSIFDDIAGDLAEFDRLRLDQGLAMLLIGVACFAFTLVLLLDRMKLEKSRLGPLDCSTALAVFLFSAWIHDKELGLIVFLFEDVERAFVVIISLAYSVCLWLFVFYIIIVGILSNAGVSEESMRLKIDSIFLVAGASAVFVSFILTSRHFLS